MVRACMGMCVCVCEREREGEWERKRINGKTEATCRAFFFLDPFCVGYEIIEGEKGIDKNLIGISNSNSSSSNSSKKVDSIFTIVTDQPGRIQVHLSLYHFVAVLRLVDPDENTLHKGRFSFQEFRFYNHACSPFGYAYAFCLLRSYMRHRTATNMIHVYF